VIKVGICSWNWGCTNSKALGRRDGGVQRWNDPVALQHKYYCRSWRSDPMRSARSSLILCHWRMVVASLLAKPQGSLSNFGVEKLNPRWRLFWSGFKHRLAENILNDLF
jgi:hypothetical protein